MSDSKTLVLSSDAMLFYIHMNRKRLQPRPIPRLLQLACVLLVCAAFLFGGCAPARSRSMVRPPSPQDVALGRKIAAEARALLGTPYRYGGTTPQGFDCSGLVHYTHRRAGIIVPRSTEQQLHRSRPVPLAEVRPGDLLFFRISRSKRNASHVGIYDGAGIFIHAPSRGKRVRTTAVNKPYWKKRLVAAGRLY